MVIFFKWQIKANLLALKHKTSDKHLHRRITEKKKIKILNNFCQQLFKLWFI